MARTYHTGNYIMALLFSVFQVSRERPWGLGLHCLSREAWLGAFRHVDTGWNRLSWAISIRIDIKIEYSRWNRNRAASVGNINDPRNTSFDRSGTKDHVGLLA